MSLLQQAHEYRQYDEHNVLYSFRETKCELSTRCAEYMEWEDDDVYDF